jgi:hypothetical protein
MQTVELIKLFNAHKVKYLLIGAAACAAHGHSRATSDIDILIEATLQNAERARGALKEFGYDVEDLPIEDMLEKKILFRQYWLDIDIHPFAEGIVFEKAWKDRLDAPFEDEPSHYVSLNDLIDMKRAAGRPKDKEDLRYLLHIRKVLNEKKRKRKKKS